jgi:dUTP pyrophosphatase
VTQVISFDEHFLGTLVDLQVKCEMKDEDGLSIAYKLYPRSSLSNTSLMLSNSVGIIDSGYRGFIKASFRNLSTKEYTIEENSRFVQICHPTLKPFIIRILEHEEELSSTRRGVGGFGSTGK